MRQHLRFALLVTALASPACADPAPASPISGTSSDGCQDDADCTPGAVCQVGACVAGCTDAHGCDGAQSCCSGQCLDVASNPSNCGGCAQACSKAQVTAPICAVGVCVGDCDEGFADCNADKLGDGCETHVDSSISDCGGCGLGCSSNHDAPACSAGACVGGCDAGFADCNGDMRTDGCETDTESNVAACGACGLGCSNQNIAPSCVAGVCAGECAAGFADCNGDKASDGCETHVDSSIANCGGCGIACSQNHVTPTCEAGICAGACDAGFADCNGEKLADGCETETQSNVVACGGCGLACSPQNVVPACVAGICAGVCAAGFADCNGDELLDGCEINLGADAANCGSCGAICALAHATPTCGAGVCQIGACLPGYLDCDGLDANGCESTAATDAQNCGACGVACGGGLVCNSGACIAPICGGHLGLPGMPSSPVGVGPIGLVAAYLNGDALPDLAIANSVDSSVSVLIGKGAGAFEAHVDYPTGANPRALTAADLDGDGKQDLAVPNWSDNTVSVLLNLGNGMFGAKIDYPAGGSPESVVAADLDGDGDRDLALTGYYANGVSVLLNKGDGTFAPVVTYPIPWSTQTVAAADLDEDEMADLVVVSTYGTNKASVLMNQGGGTFGAKVDYPSGNLPSSTFSARPAAALADLNGDGKIDIVTSGDGASVLLNQGNGTFAPPTSYSTAGFSWEVRSIALADFNGDGAKDIAIAIDADLDNGPGDLDGNVTVLINQGNGTFGARQDYLTGLHPLGIVTADFDGNGHPDLAVSDYTNNPDTPSARGNDVNVLLNLGNGTFPTRTDHSATNGPYSVAVGDLSGDGKADFVIANAGVFPNSGQTVSVFLNAGAGVFPGKVDYMTATVPISVAISIWIKTASPISPSHAPPR